MYSMILTCAMVENFAALAFLSQHLAPMPPSSVFLVNVSGKFFMIFRFPAAAVLSGRGGALFVNTSRFCRTWGIIPLPSPFVGEEGWQHIHIFSYFSPSQMEKLIWLVRNWLVGDWHPLFGSGWHDHVALNISFAHHLRSFIFKSKSY